jgi:peptide/nickel transport system substrate-binding protein
MTTRTTALKLAVALTVALAVGRIVARPQEPAPATDLMATPPFDRLTLADGSVLDVEPLAPRPLPAYDPKKDPTAKKRLPSKDDPKQENVAVAEGKLVIKEEPGERADPSKVADGVNVLRIKPLNESNVFVLRRANVKTITYFEDMLLADADRRSKAGDFGSAFEILLGVRRRSPGWPGLADRADRLLFAEGKAAVDSRDYEQGLRLLGELRAHNPNHSGLSDALAAAYGGRIRRAIDSGAYYEGRKELHDLREAVGDHAEARAAAELFRSKASALVDQADKAGDNPAAQLDALTEARRIWPSLDGLESRQRAAFEALPTLDVAVYDAPATLGPWRHSAAESRISPLLYRPILAAGTEAARRGERADQIASKVEVADLGRRIEIELREGVTWSDGSGPVGPVDLVQGFGSLVLPGSPRYEGRWASLLDTVSVSGPRSVTLRLTRPALDPASWLAGPIGPAHAGADGRVSGPDGHRSLVVSGPYRPEKETNHAVLDLRAVSPTSAVRRIREQQVDSAEDGVAALVQGRVALLAGVPIRRLAELTSGNKESIRVGRLADPRLHLIALDGRADVLRNRTLRRALSYAIDRPTFLASLAGPLADDPMTGLLDGPSPKGSFAQAPGVPALDFQPLLGRMLAAAARKELGSGPITLTLDYPRLPDVERIVPDLVEAWKQIGVQVEPRPSEAGELEARLKRGEPFQMAYRVVTVAEPLRDLGPALCPGYDAEPSADALASIPSPRIVQLLLRLEQAPEIPTARGLAIELDRASRDELPILPLWQLPEHYAWHTRLTGPTETTRSLYEGIETWTIQPLDQRDPW